MPRARRVKQRRGLAQAIAYILIIVAIVAATAFILFGIYDVGKASSKTAVLSISGQPHLVYDPATNSYILYVTVKNDGTINATIQKIVMEVPNVGPEEGVILSPPAPVVVPAGGTTTLEVNFTGVTLDPQTLVDFVIVTDQATIKFKASTPG